MAYGDRTGVRKDPGEYGTFDMIGLGLAAAVGIAVATFFDLTQSGEASALFVFNKWVALGLGMLGLGNIPLYGVMLLFMAIGGLSILYFQPLTYRGAFAQGFGVLAALMTLAPSDLGSAMPAPANLPLGADDMPMADDDWGDEVTLDGISARGTAPQPTYGTPATLMPAMATTSMMVQAQGYSIRLQLNFPAGFEDNISTMISRGTLRGRLHNEQTKQTYNLFRNTGANLRSNANQIRMTTRIPGDAATTNLVARIEAEGYKIVESRFEATQGANPVWTITMAPGGGPLILQRLRRPYWF